MFDIFLSIQAQDFIEDRILEAENNVLYHS